MIIFVIFSPRFLSKRSSPSDLNTDTTWIAALKKREIRNNDASASIYSRSETEEMAPLQFDKTQTDAITNSPTKAELFYFDPNTISESEWQKLGIRINTIKTIRNYLTKGGHFKNADELQKIYGLTKNDFERLRPYVRITTPVSIGDKYAAQQNSVKTDYKIYTSRYQQVDINTADTTSFISLPGIGSKLAARIMNFREKLGGFYSIDQIGETYGLPDSTFQKIRQYLKIENSSVKKININSATVDELKSHPYIKYNLANPIIAYRNEHGAFSNIDDLKKIIVITDEVYKRISPYLTL